MEVRNQTQNSIVSSFIKIALRSLLISFCVSYLLTMIVIGYLTITTQTSLPLSQFFFSLAVSGVTFSLGWLIDKQQPGHMIALLYLIAAYSNAVGHIGGGFHEVIQRYPDLFSSELDAVMLTLGHSGWIPAVFFPLLLVPLYFPTGKLLSKRWRIPVFIVLGMTLIYILYTVIAPWPIEAIDIPDFRDPNGIAGSQAVFDAINALLTPFSALVPFMVIASLVIRYRRSEGIERIQMKWPLAAIIIDFVVAFIVLTTPGLAEFDGNNGYLFTWAVVLLFPLSVGVAILRHGLFDIDRIINRTIVYGLLTMLIVVIYVSVVGALGSLVQAQTTVLSGLVATGLIAAIFNPLRDRLQRVVNRLLYGERDEPALVLAQLARQLESSDNSGAILPNLVRTIADALKIPYVAIWLISDDEHMEIAAEWGLAPEQREMIALIYQNTVIGQLVVAPRAVNEHFNSSDRALLSTIAALTATTVRSVKLSDELRHSRQRIVSAREEERRRIRRDLHDGLGPQLASQTLGLEAVAQLMMTDPEKSQSLLRSLQAQAHEAIRDVRRLVYDLRPPALDDLGLVAALKQSASRYETGHLRFSFQVSEFKSELPAAVETAIFRIAQEAMVNVVRHAAASHCILRLYCRDQAILLEVEDDGCGLPENYQSGVGLQAMRERAAELNGMTRADLTQTGGTRVLVRLPLEVYHD